MSNKTKLLLLDSLLQEVCIESGSCQSQPSLFRAKESLFNDGVTVGQDMEVWPKSHVTEIEFSYLNMKI